jgi:hypothetical protein
VSSSRTSWSSSASRIVSPRALCVDASAPDLRTGQLGRRGRERQVDREGGASAGCAGGGDDAGVLVHDGPHRGQAQAGAPTDRLGAEERLERAGQCVGVHAVARVRHRDDRARPEQAAAVLRQERVADGGGPDCDGDRSAPVDGVARVGDEVDERVLDLHFVDLGVDRRVGHHTQVDLAAQRRADQRTGVTCGGAEVGDAGREHTAPAERQQVVREVRATSCRLQDDAQRLLCGGRGPLLQRQLGVAGDGGEEVVEVVRDAAGELAHGLQALRVPQLSLQGAAPLGLRVGLRVRRVRAGQQPHSIVRRRHQRGGHREALDLGGRGRHDTLGAEAAHAERAQDHPAEAHGHTHCGAVVGPADDLLVGARVVPHVLDHHRVVAREDLEQEGILLQREAWRALPHEVLGGTLHRQDPQPPLAVDVLHRDGP